MLNTKNILITGATGFVGAHVLNQIIQEKSVSTVYVISRNISKTSSVEEPDSILPIFEKYSLEYTPSNAKKIKVIYGNILEPNIGIHQELYQELTEKLDVIYHVAAEVHHIKQYDELKKANVDSVETLIELAKKKKKKIINFISTMGAATKKDEEGKYVEDFTDNSSVDISMGYLRSKYEAEKILSAPSNRDFVNIFRLGYISSHTETGIGLCENNQLMLFIKSCIQMNHAPDINRLINLTAVDFTASIVGSEYFMSHTKNVMHLVNSREYISWSEIIDFLNNEGFYIKKISLKAWQELLKKSGRSNALYRMLLTYRRSDADDHIIKFGKNITEYRMNNVLSFCKANNIIMPKVKYDYLKKIFNHMYRIGFISRTEVPFYDQAAIA